MQGATVEPAIEQRAFAAYQTAATGDFRPSQSCLVALAQRAGPEAQAWRYALLGQQAHASPETAAFVSHDALADLIGDSAATSLPASLACVEMMRAAVIAHDIESLDAWLAMHERFAKDAQHVWLSVSSLIGAAWSALGRGESERATTLAEQAGSAAAESAVAPAVIEATAIRALAAEALGDLEAATAHARRASRMAFTEDLPQWQYLASLVLARMRRLNGFSHLATRILAPLHRVTPRHWHDWVAWEAMLAGARSLYSVIKLEGPDASTQAGALRMVLQAASTGDTEAFAAAVPEDPMPWSSRERDLRIAVSALDASRPSPESAPHLEDWCSGQHATPPGTIAGLCVDPEEDGAEHSVGAFVVAGPKGVARRVAGLGEPMAQSAVRLRTLLANSLRGQTSLAALALAGPQGVARDDLFRTVYGFAYNAELHRNALNTLIHRSRKAIEEFGELAITDDERYVLTLNTRVVIPDPRCEHSLEDVMLRAMGRAGAVSAKAAAAQLGIPLRTVQAALKRLVDDGAITSTRRDREVTYYLEDTTFSEPTKWS